MHWMRSTQAELGDHSTSAASASLMILMLNGRLGKAWFLECTNISFWEFFSLTRTGHILVLKGSLFGGVGMPSEVKKEGCTFECIRPLFPLGVASHCGVWKGSWVASYLGEASLGVCLLFPWKDHPSIASTWGLLCRLTSLFPSPELANGLAFASSVCVCVPFSLGNPKWSLAFGVEPPAVSCSASGWVSLLRRVGGSNGFDISWSLRLLLVNLLWLETCAKLSIWGFACPVGCERVRGGPVVVGASARVLPLLLTCGSDGTLEGGFSLLAWAVPWASSRGSRASPVLAFGGGLCCVDLSRGLVLLVLQARAWCPNLRHLLHWFERPE